MQYFIYFTLTIGLPISLVIYFDNKRIKRTKEKWAAEDALRNFKLTDSGELNMLKLKVKEQKDSEIQNREARLKSLFNEFLGSENSVRYKDGEAIWRGCKFGLVKTTTCDFLVLLESPIHIYEDVWWGENVINSSKELLSVAEAVEEYLESKLKEKPSIFARIFNKIFK